MSWNTTMQSINAQAITIANAGSLPVCVFLGEAEQTDLLVAPPSQANAKVVMSMAGVLLIVRVADASKCEVSVSAHP